jgi:uncharacterized protein (TIGR03066 family)
MNARRLFVFGVAVCLLAGVGRGQDKADYAKLIVGTWEVTKADEGTIPKGATVEFTRDGKLKATGKRDGVEVTFEGTYKVEKDTFTFTLTVDGQEQSQTITITRISEKEMSTRDKDGRVVELRKLK